MRAVVLAAGYATRLYPLTRDRPKALLDVAGRPILTRVLERILASGGVREVHVVVNRRFEAQFAAWARQLRCAVPLRLLCDGSTCEADRLGALGDLDFALREAPLGDEDCLVAAGDNLLDFDLEPFRRVFAQQHRPLLLVREVPPPVGPSRYNEVTLDGAGRVVAFREKPPDPRTNLAAIALYFFPPDLEPWLRRYLAEGGDRDAPGHLLAWLVERTRVDALRIPGGWHDVGSPESLAAARAHFAAAPDA